MAVGFTARDVVWKKARVDGKLGLEPRTSPPEKTAKAVPTNSDKQDASAFSIVVGTGGKRVAKVLYSSE